MSDPSLLLMKYKSSMDSVVDIADDDSSLSDVKLQNDIAIIANIASEPAVDFDSAVDATQEALNNAISFAQSVIAGCKENPGSLFEDAFINAVKTIRIISAPEWVNIRVSIKQAKPNGVLLSDIDSATDPTKTESLSDAAAALSALNDNPLYSDEEADKTFIADTETNRIYRIGSKGFYEWLSYAMFKASKISISESAIKQAALTLSGKAKFEGKKEPVYLRSARRGDSIHIFLGDADWQTVKVTSDGWIVERDSHVKFWRPGSMAALPIPMCGGNIDELWDYLNISGDDRLLVLAWMLEAFRSDTPFPVLALNGLQGCAKSSTHSRIRMLIDPNGSNLRAAPKDIQDIYVSAGSNWVVSFENISNLSSQQQDALCTLATGGGFAARTLYTNDDETIINVKRPVIINSIPVVITAQDLTDRVINVELQKLESYRDELEINAAFEEARPRLFGALLDLFSKTLSILPSIELDNPPRMADFTRLGEAMARSMGHGNGEFTKIFKRNRSESVSRAMESSPVAVAIRDMAENNYDNLVFDGTMKVLFDKLTADKRSLEGWPKSPRGLGDAIRRQTPALDSIGISVTQRGVERVNGHRGIAITIRKKSGGNDGNVGNVVSELCTKEKDINSVRI